MRLLAIDTAASACSAAVWNAGGVVECLQPMARGHAEALLPMILEVMRSAGTSFSELDAVAVSVGPGAFTGLRVGLAAARGIALAAGLPCFGVSTLEAIAEGMDWKTAADRKLLVALDTKRGDYYAQSFVESRPVTPPAIATAAACRDIAVAGQVLMLAGDSCETLAAVFRQSGIEVDVMAAPPHPSAGRVASLAAGRWLAGERPRIPPSPVYLRAAATTRFGNGGPVCVSGR